MAVAGLAYEHIPLKAKKEEGLRTGSMPWEWNWTRDQEAVPLHIPAKGSCQARWAHNHSGQCSDCVMDGAARGERGSVSWLFATLQLSMQAACEKMKSVWQERYRPYLVHIAKSCKCIVAYYTRKCGVRWPDIAD